MTKELLFIAPTEGPQGYEVHARNLLLALSKREKDIKIQLKSLYWGSTVKKDNTMLQALMKLHKNVVSEKAPALFLCVPNQIDFPPNRQIFNYTTFEADKICQQWQLVGNSIRLTLVTSPFLKKIWTDSGVEAAKVEPVAEGVDMDMYNPLVEALPLRENGDLLAETYKNRFFAIMELTNRKNLLGLIEAFGKAFGGDKETCLIIKVTGFELAELKMKALASDANIFIYEPFLPDYIMPRLLAIGTHYVSMSHGEGWDLNCAAMGAMKRTIVVPNHTAYGDYLDKDKAFLINASKKIPAIQNPPLNRLFEGCNWWVPDEDDAIDKMRASIKSDNKEKKENLYKVLKEKYTWEHSADKFIDVMKRYL